MTKGKIVKTNGVDWQVEYPAMRDQFIATSTALENIVRNAKSDLFRLRTTMLLEAQRETKAYLRTCKTWPAIYTTVCKILVSVHGDNADDYKRLLFYHVARTMGLESCKLTPSERIEELKTTIVRYLEENL